MKTISEFLKFALLSIIVMATFSCSDDDDNSDMKDEKQSIAAIVESGENFTLLEMALKDTGLLSTFEGEGTFTVFAPTDTAFQALLTELGVEYADLTKETLEAVLKMHVLTSVVASTDLEEGAAPTTLQGEKITVSLNPVAITDPNMRVSTVGLADLEATNGIIHVIDKVILPKQDPKTIAAIVEESADFTLLEMALKDADLFTTFEGDGTFTVFAPTDAAFQALLTELGVAYSDLTKETLEAVLKMHVLTSVVESKDLTDGVTPMTLQGEMITINLSPNKITDPNSRESAITAVDVAAKNGVIHIIDKVILPLQK
ncbi:fasciclin domain-containing protein [Aquimarina agarilytica]|uniref:fasciclin domain-containing protein n=1 Tax=Aquimarina agarilytica TaxID=1087449 RepID=UPI000287A459|nr:fasciclin domain-containing protein [Aquimarina agarilytica]